MKQGNLIEIKKGEVVKKVIRLRRMFIQIRYEGEVFTIPYACYVWLKNNPSFAKIPDGYVIHHLDHDPSNDDISNLALMAKHHHLSYHAKNQNVETTIELNGSDGVPLHQPKVMKDKKGDRWSIRYYVRNHYGQVIGKNKYSIGDRKRFKTEEAATKAISELWPGAAWEE